ncbi:MAG TPA: TIGR01777 family oxidoreductase [Bacteroidia bacterium]|nr:TIGR01777 family oxidoreductase [Bacteroidia bacterium]HNT79248.1 TIGR01777 family oxidoreductase [Bacteroidia bacterium]
MQRLDKIFNSDEIIISGGTGMIGTSIEDKFNTFGLKTKILTRNPHLENHFQWSPYENRIDSKVLHNSKIWIHLSGASIASKRWTEKRKIELVESRVRSTRFLHEVLSAKKHSIEHVIFLSASGFYPFNKDEILKETSPSGIDYIGDLGSKWETEMKKVAQLVPRISIIRPGIVLAKNGGAYKEMVKKRILGFMGIPGSGKQFVPWIHIEDLIRQISFLISGKHEGIFNATANENTTMKELISCINNHQNIRLPLIKIPESLMRIALGEMSLILCGSQKLSNEKIKSLGFNFKYETIDQAIKEIESHE